MLLQGLDGGGGCGGRDRTTVDVVGSLTVAASVELFLFVSKMFSVRRLTLVERGPSVLVAKGYSSLKSNRN
jgi:hypothetical protein